MASRAVVMQHKTQRPVQFEITPATRDAVQAETFEFGEPVGDVCAELEESAPAKGLAFASIELSLSARSGRSGSAKFAASMTGPDVQRT